jgi:aromatic ring-opening dioxygenase catalytic subunit (LigB family)
MPLLGDPGHVEMVNTLKILAAKIKKPSAIIVISAHWEEAVATLTHHARPSLLYDYYGFPDDAYEIEYPAPGAPALAQAVFSHFASHDFPARLDDTRGFDHGLFVPLKIMYPEADIPCIQLSLIKGLNPAMHIRMGELLASMNLENVLVIGSGFSFHNMRAFFTPDTAETRAKNTAFEDWLRDTCSNPAPNESERRRRLVNWEQAPHARYCHPREEHLLPLHVCYGAAQRPCTDYFRLSILNKQASACLW